MKINSGSFRLDIGSILTLLVFSGLSCGLLGLDGSEKSAESSVAPSVADPAKIAALRTQAKAIFGVLPQDASTVDRPISDAQVSLGRTLYYDPRLSKNHDISCNSCHQLDAFGVDGEPTSPGHKGQRGDRNSPTTLNAALHVAQFWDGRAADVEEQAKGPVLNPVEMAMPSPEAVIFVLDSIPGYAPLFAKAFPDEVDPISYDNMGIAIGAFERGLITPAPLDAFIAGDDSALTSEEMVGLETFMKVGCIACHNGVGFGGNSYQKLGIVHPYPTEDKGREKVTGRPADRHVFKVPSLRNVRETGPWFHDGSISSLDEAVTIMAHHQLGQTLTPEQSRALISFLGALTGHIDSAYVAAPELPASGPETPPADPT